MIREITSVRELEKIASTYNQGFIFRGQTAHYSTNDGNPCIKTSFNRRGCHPHVMQKWNFYCRETLFALKGPGWDGDVELNEYQALLQHYGWRSFFIDFTSDFSVAAWFGSNAYSDHFERVVVEDWQEFGLMAFHRPAQYQRHSGHGYIYIVSKEALSRSNASSSELIRFRFSDFDSRIDRQKAVMVGPLSTLPEGVIVEILKVPVDILIELSSGLSQGYLFPDRSHDLFYKHLLAAHFEIPRHINPTMGEFGPYVRSLEIPEYDYKFTKRVHPRVAFYRSRYLIEATADSDSGVIVRVPDSFLYHTDADLSDDIDCVMTLMGASNKLTIEADEILKLPTYVDSTIYLKGAVIERVSNEMICISGLMINHPGLAFAGIGPDQGWYYRVVDGKLIREASDFDCPCHNLRKHMLEKTIVKKLQYAIAHKLIKHENGSYVVIEE